MLEVGCFRSSRHGPQPDALLQGRAGNPLPAGIIQQRRARSDAPYLSVSGLQPSAFSLQPSRRGVALIITLILLSVVTFMALAFLALSRRERSAVATVTDTAGAQYAADAALANAEAQVLANVLATTNPYNFGLLVSTNGSPVVFPVLPDNLTNLYVNPRAPVLISTNEPLGRYYLDLNRNGTNDPNGLQLVISPDPIRPFYDTNGNLTASFNPPNLLSNVLVGDPEWVGVLERPDAPYGPNNKFIARYAFIAVPIGNALDLNAIHNQVLDEKNASSTINLPPAGDTYFRNQGVGSWEINLAGFLADLNTNEWGQVIGSLGGTFYQYNQPQALANLGHAFDDARALLAWRYNNDYTTLNSVGFLYANGANAFLFDNLDGYSDGPLQTGFRLPGDVKSPVLNDNAALPWAGADNTNHYFSPSDLFDPAKTEMNLAQPPVAPAFIERLKQAGTNVSTYDRYTFYRLLSQLGTDSSPESGKMNLNYDNVATPFVRLLPTGNITNGASPTNFFVWQPLTFFTNAADRMLRAYTKNWLDANPTNYAATFNFQVTNASPFGLRIPVLISNQFVYSPAVQRVLQLAANLFDASTNTFYPSVFRPTFMTTNESGFGNVYINGFVDIGLYASRSGLVVGTAPLDTPLDVTDPFLVFNALPNSFRGNVYGVPWIIGAKKGFPSFNKFTMENVVQVTRKLQIARSTVPTTSTADLIYTNQLFVFNISNSIGVECWNSYNSNYLSLNTIQIVANDNLTMMLTNSGAPTTVFNSYPLPYSINSNLVMGSLVPWTGSAPWGPNQTDGNPAVNSFKVLITNSVMFLTNSAFYFGTPAGAFHNGFLPVGAGFGWETNKTDFSFPQFGLFTTNRLQMFMLDGNHVIDYVQFAGPQSGRNLNAEIQTTGTASGYDNMWNTNLDANNVPWGIRSQIDVSDGNVPLNLSYWSDPNASDEIDGFFVFMGGSPSGMPFPKVNNIGLFQSIATNYIAQVPYTPTVTAYEYTSWQANDPLVHYLTSDLNFVGTEKNGPTTGINLLTSDKAVIPRPSFSTSNDRYQPWGRTLTMANMDVNPWNLAYRDPLVRGSDSWDFPTNKFPNIGWLGRVHRGTPWQSVYLKATNILNWVTSSPNPNGASTWEIWTGNFNPTNTAFTAPVQDRMLFDLFTTTINDNASRGTLSVNQSGLAAWSALFSGMVAITNTAIDTFQFQTPFRYQYQNTLTNYAGMIVQPAGPYYNLATPPPMVQIVQGINATRANTNLFPLQAFTHVGDILSVPQLTEQSPFLHLNNGNVVDGIQVTNGISDEMYEWLPQQTMSLLRVSTSPRYVIYAYGQSLKPAPNGVYEGGGPLFGMITNYQVVSEFATRAVVRFDSYRTNVVNNALDGNLNLVPMVTTMVTNNRAVIENFNILPPD